LFNSSKWLEYSLFPYAVILQVTPVIAIAPLLLIYLPQQTAVIVCAWIVGFFPVLSNTTLGLNSVDRNLAGLFQLYGASRLQTLRYLKLPAALPYILGGLRIAGGLSLIGAVVAEIAAGTAGAAPGLRSGSPSPVIASTFPECSRRCCCCRWPGLSSMGCWR
jgi:NitT/TauT family transport system permease protein